MKKIIILLAALFVFVGIGWAEETPAPPLDQQTVAPAKAPEPTLEELKWQDAFITERLKVMRYEFDKLQAQQKRIQAVIKAKSQPEKPKAK